MNTYENKAFMEELRQMYEKHLITFTQFKDMERAYTKFIDLKNSPEEVELKPTKVQSVTEHKKVQKDKPQKTVEDIRNRNITVVLSLGVLMVIIAGIIFATSSWNYISNGLRIASISLFSVFFFGMSIFAGKKLKVQQSASAFWFLGTISIPVVVLAIGALGLLGQALTLDGEGRYWLLSLVGFVGIPMNLYSCLKYQYKLYAWFTYIFFLAFCMFLLPAFHVVGYVSFILICMVHAITTVIVYRLKNNPKYQILCSSYMDLAPFMMIISSITGVGLINESYFILSLGVNIISGIGFFLLAASYILLSRMEEGKLRASFSGVIAPIVLTLGVYIINFDGNDFNGYGLFIMSFLMILTVSFTKILEDIPFRRMYGFIAAFNVFVGWTILFVNDLYVVRLVSSGLIIVLLYSHYYANKKLRVPFGILIPFFSLLSSLTLFYDFTWSFTRGDIMDLLPISLTALFLTVQWGLLDYLNKRGDIKDRVLGIVNFGVVIFLQAIILLWVGVLFDPESSVLLLLLLMICIFAYYLFKAESLKGTNTIRIIAAGGILTTIFIEFYQWMNVLYLRLPLPINEAIVMGAILIISSYLLKVKWKKWLYYYGSGLSMFGLFYASVNILSYDYSWLILGIMFIMCIGLIVTFFTYKLTILNIIPLGICTFLMISYLGEIIYLYEEVHIMLLLVFMWGLALLGLKYPSLHPPFRKHKLEWFTPVAFALYVYVISVARFYGVLHVVTNLTLVGLVGLQVKRFESLAYKKGIISLTLITLLIPLYTLFDYIAWPSLIVTEIYLLPVLAIVAVLVHKVYPNKEKMKYLEQATFGLSCFILFTNIFGHDVSEGILFGMLMLLGCVMGFYRKERIYFMISTAFLALDVIYFTWVFWVMIPWWGYLLIAGLILLFFALYNEHKKNRSGNEINKKGD